MTDNIIRRKNTGEPGHPGKFAAHTNTAPETNLEKELAMPLPKLNLQLRNRPIDELADPRRRSRYDMNPPYQRGSVWGVERQRNLIKSLLMRIPIGAIVVNDRGYVADGPDTAVIDGKQRMEAMWAFVDSDLVIPAAWLNPDDVIRTSPAFEYQGVRTDGVRLGGTSLTFQRRFANIGLSVQEAELPDITAEAEVFLLINTGGIAQEDDTLDRAAGVAGS